MKKTDLAIGIDMGGTKIQGILMNQKGKILNKYRRATEAHKSKKEIAANIIEVINKLKTKGVRGVGVGIPGFAVNGRMVFGGGFLGKLVGFDIKKEIEKKTRLKVFIGNDADCFILAEHRRGAAKGSKNCIGVTIGTGIGTGIIINKKLYIGSAGGGAEAGHVYMNTDRGVKDIEQLIGGSYLVKRYEKLSGKKALNASVIMRKNDKVAKKIYKEFVLYTGLFFTNFINTLNPEVIVVGGGVSNLPFYSDVRKVVNKYAIPYMAKMCKIKKYAIGDDAGVIGAAELVFSD